MKGDVQERSAAAIAADAAHDLCAPYVDEILRARAEMAHLHAVEAEAMARMIDIVETQTTRAPAVDELLRRSLAAELATALRMNDRTVQGHLDEAIRLVRDFPVTHRALDEGRIHDRHATVIADEGIRFADDELRGEYERLVLERAETLTQGRLRPIARSIAEQLLPTSVDERHRHARTTRRVTITDLEDGMSELAATLPGILAHGIHDRLTRMGKTIIRTRDAEKADDVASGDDGSRDDDRPASAFGHAADRAPHGPTAGATAERAEMTRDDRTLDQIRADVLSDLLLTADPTTGTVDAGGGDGLGAIRATVQITIPVLTLAGLDDETAVLCGHGPIDTDTARALAGAAPSWVRLFTHPDSGALHTVDRHDPDAAQTRLLRARDEHCRFPGCRQPAHRTDKDHTRPYIDGGTTESGNLAHLCRRHHVLKHNSRWHVEQPAPGILRWTSPLGREYIDRPTPMMRFVPAVERGGGPPGPIDPPDPIEPPGPPGPRFRPRVEPGDPSPF